MSKVRVLVTGADGFIGSHLTELLVAKGYQVKALSQYNSFNNWGWLEDICVAFRRPIVEVNYLPVGLNRCNQAFAVDLFKYLRWKTNGKFLSLNDLIKTGAIYFLSSNFYEDLGVEIIDNTPEEIVNAVIEMEERLNGTWLDEPEDLELQNIFWEKFKTSPHYNERFGWINPDSRISASFLRKNHDWFLA